MHTHAEIKLLVFLNILRLLFVHATHKPYFTRKRNLIFFLVSFFFLLILSSFQVIILFLHSPFQLPYLLFVLKRRTRASKKKTMQVLSFHIFCVFLFNFSLHFAIQKTNTNYDETKGRSCLHLTDEDEVVVERWTLNLVRDSVKYIHLSGVELWFLMTIFYWEMK